MFGVRPDPYGGKAPAVKGSETSQAAARSIQAVLNPLQAKVLRYIRSCGAHGSTCDQAEEALDMKHQTCSARIRELVLKEKILDADCKRPTRSGRKATVYVTPEHHVDII